MREITAKSKVTQLLDERAFTYTEHQELYDEIADRDTPNFSLEDTILEKQTKTIALEVDCSNTLRVIDTIAPLLSGKTWPSLAIELILELLAHQTPPLCIAPNILLVVSAMLPNQNVVEQLPSQLFIQHMCTVLLHVTKMLVAFQLVDVSHFSQMFTDGTSHCKTTFEHLVVMIMADSGFKCVILSLCILPEDGTVEACIQVILDTFKEGKMLLSI
jgi:hypothetical protein